MSHVTTAPRAGPPSGAGLPGASRRPARASPDRARRVIKAVLLLSALLSVADHLRDHRRAHPSRSSTSSARCPFGDFFATEGQFAVLPLVAGTLMVTVDRAAGRGAPRARAPRCTSRSTPRRAPASSSSRPSSCSPASRRSSTASSPCPSSRPTLLQDLLEHRGRLHQRAGRRAWCSA